MIEGESKPRTDAQVMNWLSERRLKDKSGPPQDGLMAFSMEMAVSGDESYSFLGETADATKNSMVRMVGTMAGINESGLGTPDDRARADVATTQGSGIGVPAQSEKARILDQRLQAYQQMRDLDNRAPKRI